MPLPKLTWQFSADVPNMGSIQVMSQPVDVEAVDQIMVSVNPGDTDKVVGIQPIDRSPIMLVVIKPSRLDQSLTVSFDDGAPQAAGGGPSHPNRSTAIPLGSHQVFTSIGTFYQNLKYLLFTNPASGQQTDVQIFVVRDATP
jgi:hypothetical protein